VGKKSGLVCLGIGMLFIVGAVFSMWYAYPRLALAVTDRNTTETPAVAFGSDATYLDRHQDPPQIVDAGELESVRKVVGQVEASEEASDDLGEKIAVYETLSYTDVPDFDPSTGDPLTATFDRIAFDRHTAEMVDWNDTYTEFNGVRSDVDFEGLYLKFPFHTEKQDYEFWDTTLQQATPIRYESEEEIQGLTVYKFVQTVEPTDVDLQTAGSDQIEVPGYLVGGAEDSPAVMADRIYSNVRTIWVEPETGTIIDAQEEQLSTLEVNGVEEATITDVTLKYTDDTVSFNVSEWEDEAWQLKLLRLWLPLYGGIAGLVLVIAGVVFLWRGSSRPRHREYVEDGEPLIPA
jgi:Porin PorA